MAKEVGMEFAFFEFLRSFYVDNRGIIRNRYREITKKYLDYNDKEKNPDAFLRTPQFEALEMYVFVKEFMNNQQMYQMFDDWSKRNGVFSDRRFYDEAGQMTLYDVYSPKQYHDYFLQIKKYAEDYPNYIFALTMGLGKTILMATCIFYEFLLSSKWPRDDKYCHNALVFAPDKTVLQSLKEIVTFDKSKVVPPEYIGVLDANIKVYFLEDSGTTLNTLDGSKYNIIISNTQKIILKAQHKEKSSVDKLFSDQVPGQSVLDDVLGILQEISNNDDLMSNQRFEKLTRLSQMGIYVDEAHHMFGADLEKALHENGKGTSLRNTINKLSKELSKHGSKVVACYNFTGTPYVNNKILPEVIYAYGLQAAIRNNFLKDTSVIGYSNVKSKEFLKAVIVDFWAKYGGKEYEGLAPKMAIFGAEIAEVRDEIRPVVEEVLSELGIPLDKILVNVGDEKITKSEDIRDFNNLDIAGTAGSKKQFILLVNKGREGWNCRSLFSVALFRSPKSKVFVLQATMRCLRKITDEQLMATVYLSKENMDILDDELKKNFVKISELVKESKIVSAATIGVGGIAAAVTKMAFGNDIGAVINEEDLFNYNYGSFVLELACDKAEAEKLFAGYNFAVIGNTTSEKNIVANGVTLHLDEALNVWIKPLEKIFPTKYLEDVKKADIEIKPFNVVEKKFSGKGIAAPRVLIPVFPGNNCEYDTKRAFEKAGAVADTLVVTNLKTQWLEESIDKMVDMIHNSQIIMIPGGFCAGDEPEGSGKFIAAVFSNPKVKEAVMDLLKNRDGLMLGICNGFQALIKLGLVPFGEIRDMEENSPTLTFNTIGRHISCLADTKIVSNKSPWLWNSNVGDIHKVAFSHGEGRFMADEAVIKALAENNQIATQYVDPNGNPTFDIRYNPNGSLYAIEGITSPDGRCFGKMAHIERKGRSVATNIYGEQDLKVFESGVNYFK